MQSHYLLLLASIFFATSNGAGNPATFWSDYPTCEDNCHQSVWASQSCSLSNSCSCSGCLCLADSCLCETSSWLIAVAQCIGGQCGSEAVIDATNIAQSACAGAGYNLAVPTSELESVGFAAVQSSTAATATIPSFTTPTFTTPTFTAPTTVAVPSGIAGSATGTTATSVLTVTASPSEQTAASSNSATSSKPATTTSESLSLPSSGANTLSSSSNPSATPVASPSSGLSTGAKAGIGIGAALGIIIVLALVAFILWQRRQNAKLKKLQIPAEAAGASGTAELGGKSVGATALGDKKDEKSLSEFHRRGGDVSPISPAAGEKSSLPLKVAEMAAPLSAEEKQELEGRRRAAELSGGGRDIPVEVGDGERGELEARRRIYELA